MNLTRKQRLALILFILCCVGAALGLALYALQQNLNLFYTPTQVVMGEAPKQHIFRVGGLVKRGSLQRKVGLQVYFVLTDQQQEITVAYTGILPDLFREGQGVVAQGRLGANGLFIADQVLAKHDENYMPPPVAASLRASRHDS